MENDEDFTWNLDFSDWREYDEHPIEPQEKVKIGNEEGYVCIRCFDFYPYAELNQPNKTFKCWSCRNGFNCF